MRLEDGCLACSHHNGLYTFCSRRLGLRGPHKRLLKQPECQLLVAELYPLGIIRSRFNYATFRSLGFCALWQIIITVSFDASRSEITKGYEGVLNGDAVSCRPFGSALAPRLMQLQPNWKGQELPTTPESGHLTPNFIFPLQLV